MDFDGTLAPIIADPSQVRTEPGAAAALTALAQVGARIAVITGREAQTAVRLGGLTSVPGLIVEGLYGAERWQAGTLTTIDAPPALAQIRAVLPSWLRQIDAPAEIWVEDKRLSLVLHTRAAADPAAAERQLLRPASELAANLGLSLRGGRHVLEFRLPGYDKGACLRRLSSELKPSAVLYVGDDLGDVPAFEAVLGLGVPAWSVAVTSAEVPGLAAQAHAQVDGTVGVVALLAALATKYAG